MIPQMVENTIKTSKGNFVQVINTHSSAIIASGDLIDYTIEKEDIVLLNIEDDNFKNVIPFYWRTHALRSAAMPLLELKKLQSLGGGFRL